MQEKEFGQCLWSRDIRNITACLNFIQIIQKFRNGNGIPEQFHQNTIAFAKQ
jgi:hypothetical protein